MNESWRETSKADDVPLSELPAAAAGEPGVEDEAGEVGLGYCAAVRGMLNDSQSGPLHPPRVRMSEALQDVRDSLGCSLQAKKGGGESRC